MEISEHIKAILDTLPEKPGCYLMKDKDGKEFKSMEITYARASETK